MNKWLAGNGIWCPACNGTGRGEARDSFDYAGGGCVTFHDPCPRCNGERRIAADLADIVAGRVPRQPEPTSPPGLMVYGRQNEAAA